MAPSTDRVAALLETRTRRTRDILTPEGVAMHVEIADVGQRLAALAIDMVIWLGASIVIAIALIASFAKGLDVVVTLFAFLTFLLQNLYFIHFELAWQGATPGKRAAGIRVIDRKGGVLSPAAIVARNLTREVEIFLPLQLLLTMSASGAPAATWQTIALLVWVLLLAALPLFNRDHLRAGDLIAGTLVIVMPKRILDVDLALAPTPTAERFTFTSAQLQAYGAYELQVLEEMLRRPPNADTDRILEDIATRIKKRINWPQRLDRADAKAFLQSFYAAQRAELERGQLFGRYRENKNTSVHRIETPADQSSDR